MSDTAVDRLSEIRATLAQNPGAVLEALAARLGLSTRAVTDCLPEGCVARADGSQLASAMDDIAAWGVVTLLVHTPDLVLECRAPVPPGRFGKGFFNLHGEGALGGHVRAERCEHIYFVSRPFMGKPTRSVQFFNRDGAAMFKVFVGRDAAGALLADQVARFEALRQRLCRR